MGLMGLCAGTLSLLPLACRTMWWLPQTQFVTTFKPELEALFEKRAHSQFVLKLVQDKPSLLPIYFPLLLAKAGSSDFGTANAFSNAVESVDQRPMAGADTPMLYASREAFHN